MWLHMTRFDNYVDAACCTANESKFMQFAVKLCMCIWQWLSATTESVYMPSLQMSPPEAPEVAAAAVTAQLETQEWNMQEIERIQEEQACPLPLCGKHDCFYLQLECDCCLTCLLLL